MKSTSKSKQMCKNCGSYNLKARITTYPIKIKMKQLNVGRVSVKQCLDCDTLMPTKAGKEKIERGLMAYMSLMIRHNPSFD